MNSDKFNLLVKSELVVVNSELRRNAEFFSKVLGISSRNTQRNFKSDWNAWETWISKNGGMESFLTMDDEQLNLLISYTNSMVEKGLKAITIRRRLAGLAAIMRIMEIDGAISSSKFKFYLKTLLKTKSTPSKQAEPMRFADLCAIAENEQYRQNIKAFRGVVILKVAFDSLCRSSELQEIRQCDIRENANGSGSLLVKKSKNDQAAIGSYRYLSKSTMKLVKEWMMLARAAGRKDFLFCPVSSHSNAIRKLKPGKQERAIGYSSILSDIKFFGREFSAHSTRVGALLELLKRGEREYEIQMAGGWKSTSMISYYGRSSAVGSGAMAKFWKEDN